MQHKNPKRFRAKVTRKYKYAVIKEPSKKEEHNHSNPAYKELRDFMFDCYESLDVANNPILATTLCLKIRAKILTMPEYKERVRTWAETVKILKTF